MWLYAVEGCGLREDGRIYQWLRDDGDEREHEEGDER
jgi:hypothetical protein